MDLINYNFDYIKLINGFSNNIDYLINNKGKKLFIG